MNSAFVVAAASRESGFSEVDVENTAMTGQKKPDAEPKGNFKSQKGPHNID